MDQITLEHMFLAAIALLLIGLFMRIGYIGESLAKAKLLDLEQAHIDFKHSTDAVERTEELLRDISVTLEKISLELDTLRDVASDFRRYRLPNARERAVLGQIEIDNEVAEGIEHARKSRKYPDA